MRVQERINLELGMVRKRFPGLEYRPDGQWVLIPKYSLPSGWSLSETSLAFQIPVQYPASPPYGIYVPMGLLFNGQQPNSYSQPAPTQPPFGGVWGVFSW